jgi:hypothetical protein
MQTCRTTCINASITAVLYLTIFIPASGCETVTLLPPRSWQFRG